MATITSGKSASGRIRVVSTGIAFGLMASLLSSSAAVAIPKDCISSPLCNEGPVLEDPTPPPPPTPCKFTAKCPVYDPADQVLDPGTGNPGGSEDPEQEDPEQEDPQENGQQENGRQDRPSNSGTSSQQGGGTSSGGTTPDGEADESDEEDVDETDSIEQVSAADERSDTSTLVWIVLALAGTVAAGAAGLFVRRRQALDDEM